MELKKRPNIVKRYWIIINNGLFLFGIRNKLAKIGLDIDPYYWVQEEFEPCEEPQIKGNTSEYHVRYFDVEEIKIIAGNVAKELTKDIRSGQLYIGLEHKGEVAAFTFIDVNDFVFKRQLFKLKDNEAYLLNMWTLHSFRGRNLAPYLRYQAYKLLEKRGRHVKYSITQYFNKSSIKFKKKLNSKHLKLYISIALFKKYHWNFLLRTHK